VREQYDDRAGEHRVSDRQALLEWRREGLEENARQHQKVQDHRNRGQQRLVQIDRLPFDRRRDVNAFRRLV
jgi:hypothetical protein